ncbi:hypothetical protein P7C70_g5511, partial [Phenoliferia sp. Uapishka_3]
MSSTSQVAVPNVTGNPYSDFQLYLVSLMYPPLQPGYLQHLDALFGLLIATIVLAMLYTVSSVRKVRREGRKVWLVRIIKRPQGRYLITNQTFIYPIGVLTNCIIWLLYTTTNRRLLVSHTSPLHTFYWIQLSLLPAFSFSYLTTLSYLASSNLLSSPSSTAFKIKPPGHHFLSAKISNMLFVTLPLGMVAIYVTSMRAGHAFSFVAGLWEELENDVGKSVGGWNETMSGYQDVMGSLQGREVKLLHAPYRDFIQFHRVSVITDVVCFGILVFVNLAGLTLLTALRRASPSSSLVPRLTPLVAPLGPLASADLPDEKLEHSISIEGDYFSSKQGEVVDGEDEKERRVTGKGHRLGWDVMLFYVGVIPSAALYLVYASWILAQPDVEFGDFKT